MGNIFKSVISEHMLRMNFVRTSCEIALRIMPQITFDTKLVLVQVMAWCGQATNHYLSQCWSISVSPYSVTRPQWVNHDLLREKCLWHSPTRVLTCISKYHLSWAVICVYMSLYEGEIKAPRTLKIDACDFDGDFEGCTCGSELK